MTRRDGKLVTRNDGKAAIALPCKGGFIDSVRNESQSIYSPPKCTKFVQVISIKIGEKYNAIIFTKIYTTQHFAIKPFHKKGTTHSTRAKFTSNQTDTQVWLLNRIPHPPGLHYVFPRVSINTMQLYKQQYTY